MRLVVIAWLATGCLSRPSAIQSDAVTPPLADAPRSSDGSSDGSAAQGVQLVQSVMLTFGGGDTTSARLPQPIQPGDSLIAVATFDAQSAQVTWSDSLGQSWTPVNTGFCSSTGLAIGYLPDATDQATDLVTVSTNATEAILGLGVYEFTGLGASLGSASQCPALMSTDVSTPSLDTTQPALLFAAFADSGSVLPYDVIPPFVIADVNSSTYSYAAAYDAGGAKMGEQSGSYTATTTTPNMTDSWIGVIAAFAVP
ncbi:MAG TPA: hypothetical protein VGF94_07295 [Kofleriaceae bacterium]